MTALRTFARLIGLSREDLAEDALRSESAARLTLSRRGLLLGGASLAAGSAFSFGPARLWVDVATMHWSHDESVGFETGRIGGSLTLEAGEPLEHGDLVFLGKDGKVYSAAMHNLPHASSPFFGAALRRSY